MGEAVHDMATRLKVYIEAEAAKYIRNVEHLEVRTLPTDYDNMVAAYIIVGMDGRKYALRTELARTHFNVVGAFGVLLAKYYRLISALRYEKEREE